MKISIFFTLLILFLPQLDARALDTACATSGKNPLWAFVNAHHNKSYRIEKDSPLPGSKIVNAAIFGENRLLLNSKDQLRSEPMEAAKGLYSAASMGRIDTSFAMISSGVSANVMVENNLTPLYAAVQYGCNDEIKFLVKKGADINFRANVGFTLLEMAVSERYFQTASLLMDLGYQVTNVELLRVKNILHREKNDGQFRRIFKDKGISGSGLVLPHSPP